MSEVVISEDGDNWTATVIANGRMYVIAEGKIKDNPERRKGERRKGERRKWKCSCCSWAGRRVGAERRRA